MLATCTSRHTSLPFARLLGATCIQACGLVCVLAFGSSLLGCADPGPPTGSIRILALGDSLTAGFGLPAQQAWPAQATRALRDLGWDVEIINAGVSGDTTADGRSRLPALLNPAPDLVFVALGGNDGLRRRPIEQTEADLDEIVRQSKAAGAQVALAGLRLPMFIQGTWTDVLSGVFKRVASRHDLPLLPNFMVGVLGSPELLQSDGIHPNAKGQQHLARTVVSWLEQHHRLP